MLIFAKNEILPRFPPDFLPHSIRNPKSREKLYGEHPIVGRLRGTMECVASAIRLY